MIGCLVQYPVWKWIGPIPTIPEPAEDVKPNTKVHK